MSPDLLSALQDAQQELEPRLKALQAANSALKRATRLAGEEKSDALAMQKALLKLQATAEPIASAQLDQAVSAFAEQTREALDALAFQFARDLKEVFEQRGQSVSGRPPTLVVDSLVLHIDIATRKAQWFYGREALTRPIPLSLTTILKAYDQKRRSVLERTIDVAAFLAELHRAWQDCLDKRQRPPVGKRINVVETYSQLVLNRQSARFWNSPSRSTFKDYERSFFVRDLVLAQTAPTLGADGKTLHLRLGVATKSQADNPMRSIWLPQSALDGEYYADLAFLEE